MFVRTKPKPNSPKRSIQIVESFREGEKVRQRVIRHVGVASDDEEEATLKERAELIKAKMLHELRPSLFSPEHMAELAIDAARRKSARRSPTEN